jgi:hypothetical protein
MSLFKKKESKEEPPEIIRYKEELKEKDEYWKTRNQEIEIKKYPNDNDLIEWKNSIEQLEKKRIRDGKKKIIYPSDD